MDTEKIYKKIKTYGRSMGKSLSEKQINSMKEYFLKNTFNNFQHQFDNFILEIGFGNSENLFWLAEKNPNTGIIGIDPFKNSCSKAISKLSEFNHIKNILVINDDALELLNKFPNMLFEKIYVLFPDPWPKKKHNKRRLLNEVNLNYLLKKVKSYIYFATDNQNYFKNISSICDQIHDINKMIFDKKPDDFSIITKYEQKALEKGINPMYMIIEKL